MTVILASARITECESQSALLIQPDWEGASGMTCQAIVAESVSEKRMAMLGSSANYM